MLEYLGPDRNVGLCSSPSQVTVYRDKSGFKVQDTNAMVLHESAWEVSFDSLEKEVENVTVKKMERSDLQSIISYDEQVVGLNRAKLLEPGLTEPESTVMVAISDSKVVGYGAIKPTNCNKPMIAPLYADNPKIASCLLFHLLDAEREFVEKGLVMFILNTNQSAMDIAAQIGLKGGYFCPRLWTKSAITGDVSKIYGLYSPDFHPF